MSDLDVRVRTVIAEELGRPLASVVPATFLRDDLQLDGEDLAYLLAEVESEFGIALEATAFTSAKTIGDIIRLVEGQVTSFARRPRR